MRIWTDRLAGRPLRPRLMARPGQVDPTADAKPRTPDELLTLLDDAERDLSQTAAACDLGSIVAMEWPAGHGHPAGAMKAYTFTRAAVIAHVTTHGYHHRAQCLNMLRQLGAPVPGVTDGYPELSAVDWQAAVELPPAIRLPAT